MVQLADELEALIRAGLPLGEGLRTAAGRWRGSLGQAARKLADQLEQGAPPIAALERADDLPALFRAVAVASLRSGRPGEVLAAFASSGRQTLELHGAVVRGMMYPLIVIGLALVLSTGLLVFLLPEYGQTLAVFRIPAPAWYDVASRVRAAMISQEGKIVCVVAAGLAALWFISRRGTELTATLISNLLGGRRATRDLRLAAASRTLALLLESDVELPTALRLTSGLVLDSQTQRSMDFLAGLTNDGRPLAETANALKSLPPLWRAIFTARCSAAETVENLYQAADLYGGRAAVRADAMMRFLPTLLVCLIGGSITALYASAVFVPLSQLWQGLGGAE